MESLFKKFLGELKDPMTIVLIIAAIVSAITAIYAGESLTDTIIILAVVLINACLGVYQESKAEAAIEALQNDDFVFVHVEASDEAGHDGDLELKLKTIEYLDQRLIKPIYEHIMQMDEPVCLAVLPDHLTPVEMRIHVGQPVPFLIWHRGIVADEVEQYDEVSCVSGSYGLLKLGEFMNEFMKLTM